MSEEAKAILDRQTDEQYAHWKTLADEAQARLEDIFAREQKLAKKERRLKAFHYTQPQHPPVTC